MQEAHASELIGYVIEINCRASPAGVVHTLEISKRTIQKVPKSKKFLIHSTTLRYY